MFHSPSWFPPSHCRLFLPFLALHCFFPPSFIFFLFNSPLCKPFCISLHFLVQSLFVLSVAHIMIYFTVSLLPNPPIFALQFCALFRAAFPAPRSSIFAFFLHMSWHHRCVPNVPQTLFSTIKLLSLLSPAAARITWAEGALFKYRAALGRGKTRVWRKDRMDGRKSKRKCRN